jgi:hypothetical protein
MSTARRYGGRWLDRSGLHGPAIHGVATALEEERVVEIVPIGVQALDQADFPGPWPVLDIFLALDSRQHVFMPLVVGEAGQTVPSGETRTLARAVLVCAAHDVVGDAHVRRAVAPIRHDIHPAAIHAVSLLRVAFRSRGWRAFAPHDDGDGTLRRYG